ncbi:twin-arginine translocase TatA/TatE family subunit [Candidatus Thiothrix anitrata]|jgi:sec-independent protein translocase protein TatA|uniref:Sec-independent protein translocase protein TatA n=1 Tax=Candidatus Thiothrix anitrata TaxID=2823902 RepID=A0ABX7X678_9GAMM|nr:twin-arginine translocase TatA/TatE family subunit [Candidatus Thiothrix anitrata]QTR50777.1 twin-arginine translocase TatA/TatE family subunit [Candidatus Thiothrix anitrata]
MGFGSISPWSLLLILVIILLLFGTKRLRNMGSDLGETFKNFKKSMKDGQEETTEQVSQQPSQNVPPVGRVIDSEAKEKDKV